MPGGLQTAYLAAFIPSLWRKKIAPKLLVWDREQASKQEYPLLAQANIESGWPELMSSAANQYVKEHASPGSSGTVAA